ncbi:MAG: PIN domain-containing protein [Nanoarchaeota archaeon]
MPLTVVLDSNILFRILISQGDILEIVFNSQLDLLAPLKLKEEFERHKKELLSKTKLSEKRFDTFVQLIFKRITFVPLEEYKVSLPKAKQLLKNHSKDEEFIALCVSKGCKLWTYEVLLFNIGFGISTKEVSTELKKLSDAV